MSDHPATPGEPKARFSFVSLGCAKNLVDSERMLGLLTQDGYALVPDAAQADLVVIKDNPLENFKVLYGTGHFRLDENNHPVRGGGIRYTIKDGIIYDARELLSDVRAIVTKARADRGLDVNEPVRLPYTTE